MSKQTITLYVNEPMGGRWKSNLEAARSAEKEFGAEVVIISKASDAYRTIDNPPPCPSVAVNDVYIVKDGITSYADLKVILLKAG